MKIQYSFSFSRFAIDVCYPYFSRLCLMSEDLNVTESICKWSFIVFSFCLIHSINLTYSTDLFKGNNAVFVEMYKAQIKFPAIIVIYIYITRKYHQKLHSFNAVFGYILNNDIDFLYSGFFLLTFFALLYHINWNHYICMAIAFNAIWHNDQMKLRHCKVINKSALTLYVL